MIYSTNVQGISDFNPDYKLEIDNGKTYAYTDNSTIFKYALTIALKQFNVYQN